MTREKNPFSELDRILEILSDAEEHKLTELYGRVSLTPETIRTVIEFFKEHGLVEVYLKEDGIYVRITSKGLEFLTFPPNEG